MGSSKATTTNHANINASFTNNDFFVDSMYIPIELFSGGNGVLSVHVNDLS